MIKDGIPVPATSDQPPGPQDLMDVVWCGCKAEGKACGSESCSCYHGRISCTVYCTCACSDDCFNPFKRDQLEDEDEAEDERSAVDVQEGDEEDEYHAFNSNNSYE